MIGTPGSLNTKQDYINMVAYVKKQKGDPADLTRKLQSLLETRNVWKGLGEVDNLYNSGPDEKVMEQEEGEGENKTVSYHLFKSESDPNNAFLRLGFTEEEVNQLINDLEAE